MVHVDNIYRPAATAILVVILLTISANADCQVSENVLKAAYLERITRFVEWPEENESTPNKPFILGVSFDDDFVIVLMDAFKTIKIKNREVTVKRIHNPTGLADCNMCYLGNIAEKDLQGYISKANTLGVLLVSHNQTFGKSGIHFNFYIENNQLKFEINERSIKKGRFSVSHLLMKSSRISG
jgi:hypothetical protein